MQLEAARKQFTDRGLSIVAISYDSPEVLRNFAQRMAITFPLLSDQGSAVIKSFGIFNTATKAGGFDYGIPYPGIFIVNPSGTVTAKYFEEKYQERFTPQTILSREFGELAGVRTQAETPHLKVTTQLSQDKVRSGNRITLIADIELPKKMHVYAPGVKGYRALDLTIEKSADVAVHDLVFPKPRIMNLEAIKERVPVYEKRVQIRRDFTVAAGTRATQLELKGTLEYQACDDTICYAPVSVPLKFSLEIEPHDRQRVPR